MHCLKIPRFREFVRVVICGSLLRIGEIKLTGENWNTWRKIYTICTLSITNLPQFGLWSNTCFRGDRLANNSMSCDLNSEALQITLKKLVPSSHQTVGRDSAVGIATGYGLVGPGIESRWARDISQPSRPALGSNQPPIRWVPGLYRGQSGRAVALTTQHL